MCQIPELPQAVPNWGFCPLLSTSSTFSTLLPSSFKLFMCCLLVSAMQAAYNVFSKLRSLTINISFENRSLSPRTNMDVIQDSSLSPLSLRSQFLVIGLRHASKSVVHSELWTFLLRPQLCLWKAKIMNTNRKPFKWKKCTDK